MNRSGAAGAGSGTGGGAGGGAGGERVSVVVGDRACVGCGYNLAGQPVLREPHYQLLIVRCPECGEATSMQDYPTLGRWASRWATVLAGLWLLTMASLWGVSGLGLFGLAFGFAQTGAWPYSQVLSEEFVAAGGDENSMYGVFMPPIPAGTTGAAGGSGAGGSGGLAASGPTFQEWWEKFDRAAVLERAGGLLEVIAPASWMLLIITVLVATALGLFWGTAMLSAGRWRLVIGPSLVIGGAVAVTLIPITYWRTSVPWGNWDSGVYVLGPQLMLIALGSALVAMIIGCALGPAAARGLTRALLPPRLWPSLSFLWRLEGRPLPRPRKIM